MDGERLGMGLSPYYILQGEMNRGKTELGLAAVSELIS
jgi:hypothetical protein